MLEIQARIKKGDDAMLDTCIKIILAEEDMSIYISLCVVTCTYLPQLITDIEHFLRFSMPQNRRGNVPVPYNHLNVYELAAGDVIRICMSILPYAITVVTECIKETMMLYNENCKIDFAVNAYKTLVQTFFNMNMPMKAHRIINTASKLGIRIKIVFNKTPEYL